MEYINLSFIWAMAFALHHLDKLTHFTHIVHYAAHSHGPLCHPVLQPPHTSRVKKTQKTNKSSKLHPPVTATAQPRYQPRVQHVVLGNRAWSLYPMRDGTLFQSYKCKCANGRLEHFVHWHFIHLTSAAWEVQMHHRVNTFRKKYPFHSGNVKPGYIRNIQNIYVLSLLLHWTSENFRVHFPTHIYSIPFSMQMARGVPAGSPAGLKPSHACLQLLQGRFPNCSQRPPCEHSQCGARRLQPLSWWASITSELQKQRPCHAKPPQSRWGFFCT